jgi:hypothetical protein
MQEFFSQRQNAAQMVRVVKNVYYCGCAQRLASGPVIVICIVLSHIMQSACSMF